SEHEHRRPDTLLSEEPAHLETVEIRQHHVEEDDVVLVRLHEPQRLAAVLGDVGREPLRDEPAADERGHPRLVLDHQHPHGRILSRADDGFMTSRVTRGSSHPPYGSRKPTKEHAMKHAIQDVAVVAAAALAFAATPASPARTGFSARVDNPWFPLVPGTRYVYTGVKDGKPSRDVVVVGRSTRTIAGAPCAVVFDRLYLAGHLEERTTDWYSQDAKGNVWYFGENTAELDANGRVTTTEGTWTTGVDGAEAGIYMPANPRVGQTGRQEY